MKKILLITGILIIFQQIFAQQDPLYTHYMENTLAVNPAYAGSRNALTGTLLHRSQWVGFDGAPVTQSLTIHSPFANNNIGLGLAVLNDKVGILSNKSLYLSFAYKLHFEKSTLAFGISGGFNYFAVTVGDNYIADENDNLATDFRSKILPNFGLGVYYYSPKYYVGLSVPRTLSLNMETGSVEGNLLSTNQYFYLISGAVFDLNKNFSLFPTSLLKYNLSNMPEFDGTLSLVYKQFVRLGAMFRTSKSFGALFAIYPKSNFSIGYSFDWSANNRTGVYNSGTHEVFIRFDLIYPAKRRIYSPRLF